MRRAAKVDANHAEAAVNVVVTYPERIDSVANHREHWAKKAGRAKRQRTLAWAELRHIQLSPLVGALTVRLTRIAPRLLDSDNLAAGFKATRDGVADWLKVDDGDKRLTFEYAQERGAPKHYAVRIEVKSAAVEVV